MLGWDGVHSDASSLLSLVATSVARRADARPVCVESKLDGRGDGISPPIPPTPLTRMTTDSGTPTLRACTNVIEPQVGTRESRALRNQE